MKFGRLVALLIVLIVSLPVCFAQSLHLIYDDNGNFVTGDGKYRIYNDLNQLTEIRNGSNATAPLLEAYEYHPMEERIWLKDVYEGGVYKETIFYDNENLVQTQNSSGNQTTLFVKHEGQIVAQQNFDSEVYLVAESYGAYVLATNNLGTIVEDTRFEPFGRIIQGGERTRFDYEDQEYSAVTGDYDFHFRKYDANLKIFTQPDTIMLNMHDPQKLNRYAFERGNPYRYNDPTGHYEEDFHYEITYTLAKDVGFSVADAARIATANRATDTNLATSPYNPDSTVKYHFASREDAKQRVLDAIESGDLDALGQALHTYQDTYSHSGETPWTHPGKTAKDKAAAFFGIKVTPSNPDNPLVKFDNAVQMGVNTRSFLAAALDSIRGGSSQSTSSKTGASGGRSGAVLLSSDYKEIRPGVLRRVYYNENNKLTTHVKYTNSK